MLTVSSSAVSTYLADFSEIATSTGMLIWAGLGILGFCSGLVSVVIARRRIAVVPNEPPVRQAMPDQTGRREMATSTATSGTEAMPEALEVQPV